MVANVLWMGEVESKSRDLGSDRGYRVAGTICGDELLRWGDVGSAGGDGIG
jgi:hypothetical protein